MFKRLTEKKIDWKKGFDELHHQGARPETGRPQCEMEDLFWNNTGVVVDKWHHYLPIYERYFAAFRGKPLKFLEIGVFEGGSLSLWRKFFGSDATIYGIDINPECARLNGESGQVRIGSQDDPEFLNSVVEEMGGVDIILDDGSHVSSHVRSSFEILYPKLNDGGLYLIEDLHTAYWKDFKGGYYSKSSFMNDVKQMIDDMHHWYHNEGEKIKPAAGHLHGMHIYDSIVVLEKEKVMPPKHTRVGVAI